MTRKQLGEFIKQQRILQNMSQKDLSEKIDCRRQLVIEVEANQYDTGIGIYIKMLEALGFQLMPTISSTELPKLDRDILFNFITIKPAQPEDDPLLQQVKKKRIVSQNKKSN